MKKEKVYINCQNCDIPFIPVRKSQKFCTKRCRWIDWDKKHPRVNRSLVEQFPQDLPASIRRSIEKRNKKE